jgi:hypothetical protein
MHVIALTMEGLALLGMATEQFQRDGRIGRVIFGTTVGRL